MIFLLEHFIMISHSIILTCKIISKVPANYKNFQYNLKQNLSFPLLIPNQFSTIISQYFYWWHHIILPITKYHPVLLYNFWHPFISSLMLYSGFPGFSPASSKQPPNSVLYKFHFNLPKMSHYHLLKNIQ